VDEVVVVAPSDLCCVIRQGLETREVTEGAKLRYLEQRSSFDLAGALRLVAPVVDAAPCIVHFADGLLSEPLAPLLEHLRRDDSDVALMVHLGAASDQHLSAETQNVLHIAELDPERTALGMAGVCMFGPGALGHATTVASGGWREIDLVLVAQQVVAGDGNLRVHLVDGWRRYTGDTADLLELNRIALDQLQATRLPSTNGNRIEGRVKIHDSASVRGSVIVGPTVIGPGAHIADAYIGPYTSVGSDARIEGCEIERSIISSGASVMHVGCRLAASVVGRDARIFRDFSLPRALRLRVSDGDEVALC
jgi:glucose-1-phosphate thymidylyltransferase